MADIPSFGGAWGGVCWGLGRLLFIQQVRPSRLFELLYITLPAAAYFVSRGALFNHRAHIRHADEFLEERSEEAVARAEVAISLNKIGKVELTTPYFFVREVR